MAAPLRRDVISPLPPHVFSVAITADTAAAAAASSSASIAISFIESLVDVAVRDAGDRTAEQSRALANYIAAQCRYYAGYDSGGAYNEYQRCRDIWMASVTATDAAVQNAIKAVVDDAFEDTRARFLHPAAQAAIIKKNVPPHRHISLINTFSEMYFQPDVQTAIANVFVDIKAQADPNQAQYDNEHATPDSSRLL